MQQRREPLPETQPLWDEVWVGHSRKCTPVAVHSQEIMTAIMYEFSHCISDLGQDILFCLTSFFPLWNGTIIYKAFFVFKV